MSNNKPKHAKAGSVRKGARSRRKSEDRREAGLNCTEVGSVVTVDECGCVERRRIWACEEAT